METIILTDNKRLSTDYSSDKTLFTQKIDVNHLLNTEVYQSHISKVRFWIVKNNFSNEQSFVLEVCKNLVNRGSNPINFEFSVSKICDPGENIIFEEKRSNLLLSIPNRRKQRSSNCSNTRGSKSSFSQSSSFNRTNSKNIGNFDNILASNNFDLNPGRKTQNHDSIFIKKFCTRDFEISNLTELNEILLNKQQIYSDFDFSFEDIEKLKRIVTTYIFRQSDIQIGINVINEGSRKYIEKTIQTEMSETFDLEFNSRKQSYQNNCLNQNGLLNKNGGRNFKLGQEITTKQTYHKILLFLFTHIDPQVEKQRMSKMYSNFELRDNKFIAAIQEWKIKDEDINITEKLSKEFVLIKQEVENQKMNFKNKLKIFETIIGESVNVQKLLNEQKQLDNTNTMIGSNPTQNNLGVTTDMNKTRKSDAKSLINNNQQSGTSNNSNNNSEFKRLKQSFEMIRNIDNIVNEQNKKIQNLKKYLKQVIKEKNEIFYKHAHSLNEIKKQIRLVRQEIQQKNIEFKFKTQKTRISQIQKVRNFNPTTIAQNYLTKNVNLFKKIILNEGNKLNDNNFLNDDPNISKNKMKIKSNVQYKDQLNSLDQNRKVFIIRKQHKTFHQQNSKSIGKPFSQITDTITYFQKQRQDLLLKKRQGQVENNILLMNVNRQKKTAQNCWQQQTIVEGYTKQEDILLQLYKFYQSSNQLLQKVSIEASNFKLLNQQNLILQKRPTFKKRSAQLKLQKVQLSMIMQQSPINMQQLPVLNKLVNPRYLSFTGQSQEVSIISDKISQVFKDSNSPKASRKRITIENLFNKR